MFILYSFYFIDKKVYYRFETNAFISLYVIIFNTSARDVKTVISTNTADGD